MAQFYHHVIGIGIPFGPTVPLTTTTESGLLGIA